MSKQTTIRWLRWGWPALLWMVLIFALSHQTGGESQRLSGLILSILEGLGAVPRLLSSQMAVLLVRKAAHLTLYLVLAFLTLRWFRGMGWSHIYPKALAWCLLFAISDEWHQSFVAGRGSSLWDVLIDFGGAMMGAVSRGFWEGTRRLPNRKPKRKFS